MPVERPRLLRLSDRVVDLHTGEVLGSGQVPRLTGRELEVLQLLAELPGESRERAVLMDRVWGSSDTEDRVLDTTVRRLRQKLESAPSQPVHLLTDYGVGYRFQPSGRSSGQLGLAPARDAFVGRRDLLQRLGWALERPHACVCLSGTNGVGKTRLAREVAVVWLAGGAGAACLVDAGRVDGLLAMEDLLRGALLRLGIQVPDDLESALARLGPTLVVLDNLMPFPGAAMQLQRWARQGEGLRILSTGPSSLEAGFRALTLGPLHADEAVELLLRRYRERFGAGLVLSTQDAEDLVETLGTLPHVIELAVGQLSVLTPPELAALLQEETTALLDLPGSASEALLASISRAWGSLDEPGREALVRLGVFRGGFDLAAAHAVLSDVPFSTSVASLLDLLIERSLLWCDPHSYRLRFFDAVQSFAELRVSEHPQRRSLERRHAEHLLAWMERHAGRVRERGDAGLFRTLALERDNLMAVVQRDLSPSLSARALVALYPLTRATSSRSLLTLYAEVSTAQTEGLPPATRAELLMNQGRVLYLGGQVMEAFPIWSRALEHCKEPHLDVLRWRLRGAIGMAEAQAGVPWQGIDLSVDLAQARAVENWDVCAHLLIGIAEQRMCMGDMAVESELQQALRLCERTGNVVRRYITLESLARRVMISDSDLAAQRFVEALALARSLELPLCVSECLLDTAMFWVAQGEPDRAELLLLDGNDFHGCSELQAFERLVALATVCLVKGEMEACVGHLQQVLMHGRGFPQALAEILWVMQARAEGQLVVARQKAEAVRGNYPAVVVRECWDIAQAFLQVQEARRFASLGEELSAARMLRRVDERGAYGGRAPLSAALDALLWRELARARGALGG